MRLVKTAAAKCIPATRFCASRQRLGGGLHHAVRAAGIHHVAQQPVQVKRVGRGECAGLLLLPDLDTRRANQPGFMPRRLQNFAQAIAYAGFAVGACDGYHCQLPCGVAKKGRAHMGIGLFGVCNNNLLCQAQIPLGHHHRRALLQRINRARVAVKVAPLYTHKGTAGGDGAGILCDCRYCNILEGCTNLTVR